MNVARKYPPLKGWLTMKDKSHTIQVQFASRFSLWVVFDENLGDLQVQNLDVQVDDQIVCLGPCRTLSDFDKDDQVIWLVPTQTLYDLEVMFTKKEIKALPLDLSGLPQWHDYRRGIDPVFSEFISDLTYELNDMMAQLDKLDAQLLEERPLVQSVIQSSIVARAGPRFDEILNVWNQKLLQFIAMMSPVERDHYGSYFRRQVWSILLRAPIFAQSNLRVHGEAEDSEIQKMIHRNNYEGSSTFGKMLHKYAVGLPSAQAARNVRDECAGILQNRLRDRSTAKDSHYRVLAVTKGMTLEWLERLQSPVPFQNLVLTLLDPDPDPQILAEAANKIKKLENNMGVWVQVNYIIAPLGTLTEPEPAGTLEKVFDFICSFGLLDSQIDTMAKAVIRTLYRWLSPGGEMVLTNAAADNPNRLVDEYWNDRRRYNRTKKQCLDLVADLSDSDAAVSYDETKIEMVLRVTKAAQYADQES